MTHGAVLDTATMLIDVDGLRDSKRGITYLGKAKRDEFGRWVCLAIIDGIGLCKIEISVEPEELALSTT